MEKDRKKYIEDNRAIFDDENPQEGHSARFEALLNKQDETPVKKRTIRKNLIAIISVAASIAILVFISSKFYMPYMGSEKPIENGITIDEFQATNDYYNEQMKEQIADIMCKLANTDSENQAQLTADLQKIVDNNSKFVSEMENNDNKEIAMRYLVKHYKANIEALENINEKLGKHTKC